MPIKVYDENFDIPELYQPIFGAEDGNHKRRCVDRFNIINEAIQVYGDKDFFNRDICDIGCNMGWMLFQSENCGDHSRKLYGLDNNPEFLRCAKHIASKIQSRCSLALADARDPNQVPPAEIYLLLSVSHHMTTNNNLTELKPMFDQMAKTAKYIFIEQATHLEWPDWGKKLKADIMDTNPYDYWEDQITNVLDNKYTVRLIATLRTHIGTTRPLYMATRNLNIPIEIEGKPAQIISLFNEPYVGYPLKNLPNIYGIINQDGKHFLYKSINDLVQGPVPWIDGRLLSDILKFGILPYYNIGYIKEQLNSLRDLSWVHTDLYPWNVLITRDSTMHLIDREEIQTLVEMATRKNITVYQVQIRFNKQIDHILSMLQWC
jgi:hypothetical protein